VSKEENDVFVWQWTYGGYQLTHPASSSDWATNEPAAVENAAAFVKKDKKLRAAKDDSLKSVLCFQKGESYNT